MSLPVLGSQDSIDLHLDWWGNCRTCRHWNGEDDWLRPQGKPPVLRYRWHPAKCENPASPLHGQETWTEGHCEQWDSFDTDLALRMLQARDEWKPGTALPEIKPLEGTNE